MAKQIITAKFEISRVIERQRNVIRQIETKGEKFLDAAARLGVNASRDISRPDTWIDRTGNLRSSISHFVTDKDEAVVFAGMEYAPFVHFRDGYRVLVPPPGDEVERMKGMLTL